MKIKLKDDSFPFEPLQCISYINIGFFVFTDLIVSLLNRVEYPEQGEALVYCLGALKFLSGNSTVAMRLYHLSIIQPIAKLVETINAVSKMDVFTVKFCRYIMLTVISFPFGCQSWKKHKISL